MKKNILFIFFALISSCVYASNTFKSIDFNFGWKFILSDSDRASQVKCNTDGWKSVRLPHDWSIEEGYTQNKTAGSNGFLPGGIGWYRKEFIIPSYGKNKKVFVRFEGVYEKSKVWVNGHFVGFRPNGYVGFEYDITPYVRARKNVIAVRVDRTEYADARWYVGGGIYRNVYLDIRNNDYIPTDGIYVTTPSITDSLAKVDIITNAVCSAKKHSSIQIKHQIFLGTSLICESLNSLKNVSSSNSHKETIALKNPTLWSIDQPNVYTLRTSLLKNNEIVDEKETTFGIRSIKFDANKGFLLNGKSVKIKGVNLHHDLGCVGVALYDAVLHRRLSELKKMGCNAIRTAHNPHSVSLLNMCDTMGLVVMDEFFDDWKVSKGKWITKRGKDDAPKEITTGYTKYFNEWAERDLKETIVRDRNHPSVILWSIGNEIEWTYPYYFATSKSLKGFGGLIYTGGPDDNKESIKKIFFEKCGGHDELAQTATQLAKWVKEVDLSRPTVAGVVIPSVSRISGYTDAIDVVGYNYKDSYYAIDHKKYPNQCILGSENVGQYFEWKAVVDKDYIPGIFVWTGIDYIGENGPWPAKGTLYSFFDFACFKTTRGHFFETLWKNTPKTYMVTTPANESEFKVNKDGSFYVQLRKSPLRRWEWFKTYDKWKYNDGDSIIVQVYSNAPQVELFLNGVSLGVKNRSDFAKENIITWCVPYKKGELVAVGKVNGREVSRYSLITNAEVADMKVSSDKTNVKADRYDVAHIEVELTDRDGNRVVDDDREIEIEVDKNVRILGVDNGSYKFVGNHKSNKIVTYNGKCLIILQSLNGIKESSIVKVRLKGIKENEYKINFI